MLDEMPLDFLSSKFKSLPININIFFKDLCNIFIASDIFVRGIGHFCPINTQVIGHFCPNFFR